jgi:hypothetical protein
MKLQNVIASLWRRAAQLILIGSILLAGFVLYIFWDLPSIDSLPETYMTPSVRIRIGMGVCCIRFYGTGAGIQF